MKIKPDVGVLSLVSLFFVVLVCLCFCELMTFLLMVLACVLSRLVSHNPFLYSSWAAFVDKPLINFFYFPTNSFLRVLIIFKNLRYKYQFPVCYAHLESWVKEIQIDVEEKKAGSISSLWAVASQPAQAVWSCLGAASCEVTKSMKRSLYWQKNQVEKV